MVRVRQHQHGVPNIQWQCRWSVLHRINREFTVSGEPIR